MLALYGLARCSCRSRGGVLSRNQKELHRFIVTETSRTTTTTTTTTTVSFVLNAIYPGANNATVRLFMGVR